MAESIGNLYGTLIASLSEDADIQEAFRLYHYGAPSGTGSGEYDPTNSNPANLVNPSIAYSLNNLQSQITTISGSLGVQATVWTTKGDLVTRTSSPGVVRFGVGSDGTVLTANSATATGLEWATPAVTLTNSVTLSNKTLVAPTITGLGIIFEGSTADAFETLLDVVDPTADRTITLPNVDGTVITTGNLSSITEVGTVTSGSFPVANLTGTTLPSAIVNSSLTSVGTLGSLAVTGNAVYHTAPEVKSATDPLVLSDDGKVIEMSNGGTLQVPTDAAVNFPVGTQIIVVRTGSLAVNIAAVNAGVTTINATPGLNLRSQWSGAIIIKRAANSWVALGDLA
jgi:hypothetical protein